MKKFFLFFPVIILLVACGSSPSPEDISKVSLGMSTSKVTEVLGEPSIKTTDREELTTEYDSLAMLYVTNLEHSEDEQNENRGYEEYSEVYSALQNKENVELFVYETNEDKNTIYVYFLNNEVSFFYTLDLT